MASQWDAFPDVDEWSAFPDADDSKPRAKPKVQKPTKQRPNSIEGVVDGDTLRTDGPNLRIHGMDAPESNQIGWNWDMTTRPVGAEATHALQLGLDDADYANISDIVGWNFSRPVGAVDFDGNDVGQSMIRSGNALTAPEYIDDPDKQFQYMQSERLARLNRLGVHGQYTQTPKEHRDNPVGPLPPTEDVAMFFDTPTPWAGVRPEVAQKIMADAQNPDVPLEDIVEYARQNGAVATAPNLKQYREGFLASGANPGINYLPRVEVLTDNGDGQTGAGIRSFGDGFLASGLDEVGAFADMAGWTPDRENIWNSERRAADIWYNNQQQNSAILNYDREHYPGTYTAGEVTGAITSGFVIPYGAGARSATALAKVGGVYGAAEGFLGTEGKVGERLVGAAQMAPLGAVVNAAGGKALQAAAPHISKGMNALRDKIPTRTARAAPQSFDEFPDAVDEATDIAMAADDPVLRSGVVEQPTARPLLDAPTPAQLKAASENVQPGDVVPTSNNQVADIDEAARKDIGRLAEAKAPHERTMLEGRTVRNVMGVSVPKVGPIDLVGWARLNNGINDAGDAVSKGGDLKAMGLTNSPRKGVDFVGQEARFGPLVNNDSGMSLDEAAEAAFEAGYFPELSAPPTQREFLDALRETHEGGQRRFLSEDAAEIENFYAAQADRYSLEQQQYESGGPVYNDRSLPADEPQPFPPVEAYEDWPAGGPDFAGNINLGKLKSPQDIKRALDTTERVVGFDAATRGKVSQEETTRLAAELNMTPDNLIARRQGQAFNAEEALAARQILAKSSNELVNAAKRIQKLENPGDELLADFRQKWLRHVAIQEQVSGATAEAGRALNQFKMHADSRAIRGDVLAAVVRGGGGKGDLKDAAETLIDAVESGPGVFNALAEKASKPKWRNKIGELYINLLLSNPPTHIVNTVSNTLTSIAQIPEFAVGSVFGRARQLLSKEDISDRVYSSEVGARAFGLIQGAKEGARLFARALRTGEASDFVTKVEGDEFRSISGLKGEAIRIPTRFLTAEDEFFKGVARRMEMNAFAANAARKEGLRGDAYKERVVELLENPTDEMLHRALDYGRYLTFQRQLGDFGQSVSRGTQSSLVAKIVVPFVRTPINLMKFATERSPAAPVLKEWRRDFSAGGAKRDMAVARMMIGTGFAATMYQAAQEGLITGAVPSDPAKARLLYADGWQPYSVKIGDRYVSYSRLDPFSTTIGVAADMATLPEGMSDKQRDEKATLLVASIMGNLASKTWLSGMSDFVSALHEPERNAGNWLERVAGSFTVPAGVAGTARAIDPVSRRRESVSEAIQARIPGMSQGLLPRRDVFGEPIENDSLGPDIVSPFWQSMDKNDPVVGEMLRIGKSVSAPGKQFSEDGERLDYEPEAYDRYHEISGRLVYNSLSDLIGSAKYQQADDAGKRKLAKSTIAKARKSAREVLGDASYKLPNKRGSGEVQSDTDGWDAFPDAVGAGDEWSAFADAPKEPALVR